MKKILDKHKKIVRIIGVVLLFVCWLAAMYLVASELDEPGVGTVDTWSDRDWSICFVGVGIVAALYSLFHFVDGVWFEIHEYRTRKRNTPTDGGPQDAIS